MRKILCFILLSASATVTLAQQSVIISANGGISNTSSSAKSNSYLGNGYNAGADVFVPFYRKGWDGTVKGGSFSLGIIVSGNYTGVNNLTPDDAAVAAKYKVFNGTTEVTSQPEAKSSGSFSGMAGVQGIFSLGKFNIAPSLSAGYLQLKQKGFVQNGSAEINGQAYEAALVKSEAQSISGFVFMPQVKIGYNITPGLSLFVSPSVLMGPEVKHNTQHLVPQGGFNDRNTYEIKQLANGTWENGNTTTSKYNLTRINFGVSFSLGHRSKTTMPSRLSMTPTTTRQTQGKNFGEKVASGLQSGANTVSQGASLLGGAVGSGFSGKAGPIKGVIVKGGKNDAGSNISATSDENGELVLNGLEKGSYKFTLIMPDEPQGKSINEKGVKRQETAEGKGRTYTGGRKNESQGRSISEQGVRSTKSSSRRVEVLKSNKSEVTATTDISSSGNPGSSGASQASYARPGSPIGGIVVKGGKNPGGNMSNLIVDENGAVAFEVPEAGDYKMIITAPDDPQGKSINEKGVKRQEAQDFNTTRNNRERGQFAERPGSPIGGIVVKGGKNPGGNLMAATTNEKGEVKFNGLEKGMYKFSLTMPDDPQGKSINEKGVKRQEAQDFNTTRSNRDNRLAANPGSGNSPITNDTTGEEAITRPGQPIKGVIVKGGKNPGGNMTNLAVSNDGIIEFEVLEAGNYKFIIQVPENTNDNMSEEKKDLLKEPAKSGLKDVLKTNV